MIAWWGWVLIWAGLTIALVATLAALAWWLFRKGLVLLDDVGRLADRATLLEVADPGLVRPELAVLAEASAVRMREAARKVHRTERARARRQARLDRARRITSVDASTREWPEEWYH
jgi:hypothetical protein